MDEQQNIPPDTALDQLQARHENAGDQDIDPIDIALLFNKVGSELTSIDKQSLGDNQRRAMQLDQQAVFSGVNMGTNSPKPPAPPLRATATPATRAVSRKAPPPELPPKPISAAIDKSLDEKFTALEKKISRLESTNRAYQKMKKMKHGTTYTVSSNSMKGEIKDADVLLEYVLCEISKGVKSITIKISE